MKAAWKCRDGRVYCGNHATAMQFSTGEGLMAYEGDAECFSCDQDAEFDADMRALGLVRVEGPIPEDILADMEAAGIAKYIA